jgi:hypothetical protein
MELSLLTPLILALLNWTRYWSPSQTIMWLLLLMLLPFNLTRLLSLLEMPRERQQGVMIFALLFVILIALRTILHEPQSLFDMRWLGDFYRSLAEENNRLWTRDIALFLVMAVVWWRGIRLTYQLPSVERAGLRLRLGGLVAAPLVIWIASDLLLRGVMPFILLFFMAGLTTVALIRAEQTEYERSRQSASLTPQWVGSIFAAALGVVLTGGVLALIVSGQPPEAMAAWIAPFWLAIRFGTTAVMTTALYMASPLINLLASIIQFIVGILSVAFSGIWSTLQESVPQLAPAVTPEAVETLTATPEATGAATGTKLIVILLMLAVILLVSLALSRLYRQATLAARDSERIQRDTLEPVEKPGLARRMLEKLGLLKGLRTALSIRRIYWQMCRAAAGAGYPRGDTETPYEYLNALQKVWPTNTADAQQITRAYVKIRYGEFPESEAEINEIRESWRRLESTPPAPRLESESV